MLETRVGEQPWIVLSEKVGNGKRITALTNNAFYKNPKMWKDSVVFAFALLLIINQPITIIVFIGAGK